MYLVAYPHSYRGFATLDEAEKWAAETTSGTVEILEAKTAVTMFRPAEPPPVPKRVG